MARMNVGRDGKFSHTRGVTRDDEPAALIASLKTQAADYVENVLEGFVSYDAEWRMTHMNAMAEQLLGRRRAEVLGKTWH